MLCFSPGAAVESHSFVEHAEMSRNKQPAHYFIATVVYEQMALCSAPCVCSCYGSFLITYTIFAIRNLLRLERSLKPTVT